MTIKKVDAETSELKVVYCVPDWLRDNQIQINSANYKQRIKPYTGKRKDKVALVCFGPSLNETWDKLKDFKYIISCSGSHKYLMDRGIEPTWHVEVDPRIHKIQLIGDKIGKKTRYLLASCCHPEVFKHVEDRKGHIVLWHTYSGEDKKKLPNVYPRGEWVLTGGANVGLRALTIARFLGFTDIHIFGMDGSFPADKECRHASEHPNTPKKYILADYEGKEYATTTAFLKCARLTFHELEMLPDVDAKFYGEGLIQDMAKTKVLNKKKKTGIAFYSSETISASYIKQNRILHETNALYGVSAVKHVDTIKKIYEKTESKSLLDYGCGKGLLAKELPFPIWEYDPAIPGKDSPPKQADFVVCIDVLEHIEPDYLDNVLYDLARCIKKVGYFTICTKASMKTLPDGRNSHLIQKGKEWWENRLKPFFNIPDKGIILKDRVLHVVASPRPEAKSRMEVFKVKELAHVAN